MIQKNSVFSKDNELSNWGKFLLFPDDLDESILLENKEIAMAKKRLDDFRKNECEVYIAELRKKFILDQRNYEDTAYNHGKKEGKIEGKKEAQIKVAKKMLKNNISIEDIMYLTDLSKEEIEKLM